ncbi:MAG: DNA translocase FtsK 4TM domain-containing protein [Candidatus Glassbacteria bacterium]
MARKKPESGSRVVETSGFMLCLLGTFILLSFLPPDLVHWGVGGRQPSNITGPVGNMVSSLLTSLLGFTGPVVGFILLLFGWNRLRRNNPGRTVKAIILLSSLSVISITIASLFGVNADAGGEKLYGITGQFLSRTLVEWFSFVGSLLMIAFFTSVVLVWTTGFSLAKTASLVSTLGRFFLRSPAFLLGALIDAYQEVVDWKNSRRKSAAERRVKRRVEGALTEKRRRVSVKGETVIEKRVPIPAKKMSTESHPAETTGPTEGITRAGSGNYVLPDLSLLNDPEVVDGYRTQEELSGLGSILLSKLSDFNIKGEIINVTVGPVVSTFEFRPASGIKVSQIVGLADDLALAMEVTRIRIVAPLPGRGAVGIEVPNSEKEIVNFKEIISSGAYTNSKATIPIALGKDSFGDPVVFDLVRMPHLLIAGSTGSGKSQCIHTIIMSLLLRFSPDEVRLLMIDPKVLELVSYNGIPHLLTPVVTEPKGAVRALKWLIAEMEERYKLLASIGVRNISDYNRKVTVNSEEDQDGLIPGETMRDLTELPFVVMIIDELADLILSLQAEIEEPLARLAQMARGVGIHLVLATQRPSVDVLTGMIKANFPSRISFRVATRVDSRTILDANGAEKLLGAGDMLFLPAGRSNARRVHGSYISDDELGRVIEFLKRGGGGKDKESETLPTFGREPGFDETSEEQDELFWDAVRLVLRTGHGSTSLLQRKLKIGYSRAARIVDQLEDAGVLGPQVGSKGRDVLVGEDFLEK